MAYFPLVGILLGGLLAGFDWAARDLWHPSVVGALDAAWLAVLTRGLHLTGLADTFDGLGGGRNRDQALAIMQDGHAGPFGVTAVAVILVLKAAVLAELSMARAWHILVLAPCMARWGFHVLATAASYARRVGAGAAATLIGPETRKSLVLAGATALGAGWALAGIMGIGLAAVVLGWSLMTAAWFQTRFGGVTEEILGAHVEIIETLALLAGMAAVGQGMA